MGSNKRKSLLVCSKLHTAVHSPRVLPVQGALWPRVEENASSKNNVGNVKVSTEKSEPRHCRNSLPRTRRSTSLEFWYADLYIPHLTFFSLSTSYGLYVAHRAPTLIT